MLIYSVLICIHYKFAWTKTPCWVGHLILMEQIGPNRAEYRPKWDSSNEVISSNLGAASEPLQLLCVCSWVWVLMSLYLTTVEGSPSLSSQGNSQFEWGLADSFQGNPGTWTRLPTRPTPSFISTTSKQGADMSPYRASHWRGWHWKIPAWACLQVASENTHTQTWGLTAPWLQRFSGGKTINPWREYIDRYNRAVCQQIHPGTCWILINTWEKGGDG